MLAVKAYDLMMNVEYYEPPTTHPTYKALDVRFIYDVILIMFRVILKAYPNT